MRGRLHGRQIDLDEEIGQLDGEVEVEVRAVSAQPKPAETIFEFIRRLPPGSRTQQEIDLQIADERESWGDR